MILGILSDSHGRSARTRLALECLVSHGARVVVHCGDVGGADVLSELAAAAPQLDATAAVDAADRRSPVWFVWGNTDRADAATVRFAESLDLPIPRAVPLLLRVAGRRIAVFHGHESELESFDPRAVDYVLHGHTHVARDDRVESRRVINPGALHRAARYSVATLDLVRDRLEFWTLDDRTARPRLPS